MEPIRLLRSYLVMEPANTQPPADTRTMVLIVEDEVHPHDYAA